MIKARVVAPKVKGSKLMSILRFYVGKRIYG
jgi:hypothetical protein